MSDSVYDPYGNRYKIVAGSYGPYGAFTTYRPPWEGFFIPPAMRVVAD